MCRSVSRGGQSNHRRGPRGPGPGNDDAGTQYCQSGACYHPHPETRRDSDGGSWARSARIVPGTRGDRGGTGQQNLAGQPQ